MGDRQAIARETAYVKDLPGFAKSNPQFFKDPMIDKLLEIALLMGGELWSVRDRQMIVEHLLATNGRVTPDLIETFKPDAEFESRCEEQRLAFVRRVFGCLYSTPDDKASDGNHFKWLTAKKGE